MNLEELLQKLDDIVKTLESQNHSLDECVKEFDKGVNLSKKCISILEENKGKITELKKEMDKICEYELNLENDKLK